MRSLLILSTSIVFLSTMIVSHAATFTIDPGLSSITASPTQAPDEQQPGSLTAQVQGTIEAVVIPGSLIQITGAAIGPFAPGTAPADFAGSGLFTAAALRNGSFDLAGDSTSLVGSTFEATLTSQFLSGVVDGIFFGTPWSVDITGLSFPSSPADLGSFTHSSGGNVFTLTVPIDFTASVLVDESLPIVVRFAETLVAVYAVPEPASVCLALAGSACVVLLRPWPHRRRQSNPLFHERQSTSR